MKELSLFKDPLKNIDQRKFYVDIELTETIDIRDYLYDLDIETNQDISLEELAEKINKEYTYIEIAEFIKMFLDGQVNNNLKNELKDLI